MIRNRSIIKEFKIWKTNFEPRSEPRHEPEPQTEPLNQNLSRAVSAIQLTDAKSCIGYTVVTEKIAHTPDYEYYD